MKQEVREMTENRIEHYNTTRYRDKMNEEEERPDFIFKFPKTNNSVVLLA